MGEHYESLRRVVTVTAARSVSASEPEGARPRLAPVTLQGRWVRLEPLTPSHVPGLFAVASGPRETFGFSWVPTTRAQMEHYVAGALDVQAKGHALPFAVVDPATSTVKGMTRFGNIEFWTWPPGNVNQRGENLPDAVEIGWTWYAAEAQRTGINTEAKLLMLTHAFEVWQVHRVRFMTDARNERSRRAILRLGAQFDGVLRGQMVGADGTMRHSAFYSILDTEWAEVKSRLCLLLR
jgi:RimJ/RimL family protein N-acetyltransferase